jgi:hypothetical protein
MVDSDKTGLVSNGVLHARRHALFLSFTDVCCASVSSCCCARYNMHACALSCLLSDCSPSQHISHSAKLQPAVVVRSLIAAMLHRFLA